MSTSFWRHPRFLLLLALILSLALRLPFHHISFFSVDEAVSAVAGSTILEGGLPYRDAIDHRGPLTYYAYSAIFAFSEANDMGAVHSSYLVLMLLLIYGVWFLGKTHFSETIAGWASLFFAVFSWANPFHEMWAAHTEWLLTGVSLLGMLIWLDAQGKWYKFLLAGFCFGICTLSKQVGALELGAVIGYLVLRELLQKDKEWIELIRQAALLFLGWGMVMSTVAGYFWQQGAWDDWLFYLWSYNTDYYMPEIDLGTRMLNAAKLLGAFFLYKWLLLGLIGYAGWKINTETRRHRDHLRNDLNNYLWLFCWLAAAFLEALAGGRAFLHYLIPALIPMCLVAAVGLDSLWKNQKNQSWFIPIFALGLAIPVVMNLYHHAFMLKEDTSITEFVPIVEELRQEASPEDRIFVWGFAPEIYVLSDLHPASRFSFCNVLTGHIPAGNEAKSDTRYAIVPGTWDTLMQELRAHPPRWIIDTQPAAYRAYGKYPMAQYPLGQLIEEQYEKDDRFHAAHPEAMFHLYQRKMSNLQPE